MTVQEYLEKKDFFEVQQREYDSYYYRLRDRDLMKTTPEKNMTVFVDIELKVPVCGFREEIIMGMPAKNFYIFEILDKDLLASEKTYKHVYVDEETWTKVLEQLSNIAKGEKHEENSDDTCESAER